MKELLLGYLCPTVCDTCLNQIQVSMSLTPWVCWGFLVLLLSFLAYFSILWLLSWWLKRDKTHQNSSVLLIFIFVFIVIQNIWCLDWTAVGAGKELVPYLPQLMDFLLSAVTSAHSYHAKSLAISVIGAAGLYSILNCFLLKYFTTDHIDIMHFLSVSRFSLEIWQRCC